MAALSFAWSCFIELVELMVPLYHCTEIGSNLRVRISGGFRRLGATAHNHLKRD